MAIAYIVVSTTIWLVARFSPSEWLPPMVCNYCADNEDQCENDDHIHTLINDQNYHLTDDCLNSTDNDDDVDEDNDDEIDDYYISYENVLQNDFTLANSFWFTLGSLMQQGCDLNPKVIFFVFVFFSVGIIA